MFGEKCFRTLLRKLDIECGNCIMLIIDKSVFGLPKDVLYVCSYVPPEVYPITIIVKWIMA